jgi:Reverse transcriptase (RNA-dependent DNA polymerase)
MEWESGDITKVLPLGIIAANDPVTCAIYGPLDQPGWKHFKHIAKNKKTLPIWLIKPNFRHLTWHLIQVWIWFLGHTNKPNILIKEIGTPYGVLEFDHIDEYIAFINKGHHTKVNAPSGYKKVIEHLIYDVKHDGRHKARLVADRHLTDIPLDSVYSGIMSLWGFRLVLLLAELNGLQPWATDIGNVYLEAYTSKKVYIICGPEFKDRDRNILLINKALRGLRNSDARWYDRFADCIRELGFFPGRTRHLDEEEGSHLYNSVHRWPIRRNE